MRCSTTSARTSRRRRRPPRRTRVATRAETYVGDWRRGRVTSWLTTVDHKRIGILYIATSLVFFVAGGVLALLIRTQLITHDTGFIEREGYNALFTMHGTTM